MAKPDIAKPGDTSVPRPLDLFSNMRGEMHPCSGGKLG